VADFNRAVGAEFFGARGLRSEACRHRGSTSRIREGSKSSSRSMTSETRTSSLGLRMRCRRAVRVSDDACVVEGACGERHERSRLWKQAWWSEAHLEEQQTRRGERSWARSNRRTLDTRLCMEKRLEVGVFGRWQPIRR